MEQGSFNLVWWLKYNDNMDQGETERKGELKVFLGYAPGVGKTYTMLDAAVRRQAEGIRVLPMAIKEYLGKGYDTFLRRVETDLPNGIPFSGTYSLDQILQIHPDLVVVDDVASPVSFSTRHPRRYQDVMELLENGIDVYTAMDVYQLESLQDAPWQCEPLKQTGSVPDSFFDLASVIEVIDIPPAELIQRIKLSTEIDPLIIEACSSLERLTAMREAALRSVAGRVKSIYSRTASDGQNKLLPNKILVCISSHPLAERLVRAGRRMADEMNVEWHVLFVETPDRLGEMFPNSEQLRRTFELSRSLGASVVQRHGHAITPTILEYARENGITRIIIGNPRRSWWQKVFNPTVVDQLLKQSGSIDVFVISDERTALQTSFMERVTPHSRWTKYLKAAGLVLVATAMSYPLHFGITAVNVVMIYLAAVTISAIYWGRGPSLLASVLSVLVFDFFMLEPKLSFTVEDTQYLITLLAFFIVSLLVSNLAATIRAQVDSSRMREIRTSALYNLSRELSTAMDLELVITTLLKQMTATIHRDVCLYFEIDGKLIQKSSTTELVQSNDWFRIVSWVMEKHQPAGFNTSTYPNERTFYLPIHSNGISRGVLGIWLKDPPDYINLEEKQMLEAYANLAALAMERVQLMEKANQIRISKETEKLQSALLNSISHDLRTPLSTILGTLSTLHEAEVTPGLVMDREARSDLVNAGLEEADRMNRLIGNLLDMTRLESGAIHLKLSEAYIADVIASALRRLKSQTAQIYIHMEIAPEIPPVTMDITLIEQVIVNLMDNAIKFSSPGDTIQVKAEVMKQNLTVTIADQGSGIPEDEIDRIFEKFYRSRSHERTTGSGLGLAICKGFIDVHNGKIIAWNNPDRGISISFTIPLLNSEVV